MPGSVVPAAQPTAWARAWKTGSFCPCLTAYSFSTFRCGRFLCFGGGSDGREGGGVSITRRQASGTISTISTKVVAMGNQLELLEAEALKLSVGERAAFAQLLLASLDEDAEIEEAWAVETERRIADIESGAVQVIPIADALAQVRAALK